MGDLTLAHADRGLDDHGLHVMVSALVAGATRLHRLSLGLGDNALTEAGVGRLLALRGLAALRDLEVDLGGNRLVGLAALHALACGVPALQRIAWSVGRGGAGGGHQHVTLKACSAPPTPTPLSTSARALLRLARVREQGGCRFLHVHRAWGK